MNINCEEMVVSPNKDSTYKIELVGCKFKDNNGEEIEGIITFPKVSKVGLKTFKNANILPTSEVLAVYIPEREEDKTR